MPDQKLYDLCSQIATECDPQKLSALLDELIRLLDEEQHTIKAKIRANIGNQAGTID